MNFSSVQNSELESICAWNEHFLFTIFASLPNVIILRKRNVLTFETFGSTVFQSSTNSLANPIPVPIFRYSIHMGPSNEQKTRTITANE